MIYVVGFDQCNSIGRVLLSYYIINSARSVEKFKVDCDQEWAYCPKQGDVFFI